ncbi:MAG: Gfo/Idh/MocA family oxidoreductase [candidate division KSB1 bacterium]|nr:Gfo/Idh/MocA family oxidoreductase [candidate division KSB1 bacterium]
MENEQTGMNRRTFLKAGAAAAGALLASGKGFFAGGSDIIRVGLIGCGSRGTSAGIIDCAQSAPGVQLIAIGDLFQDHLEAAPQLIQENLRKRGLPVDEIYRVTPETMFYGPEAYRQVLATEVDMVILTTPPYCRPLHFRAAVEAGKHVFLEKPVAVDPVGVRSVLETADLAKRKGLTVVAGTQMRRFEPMRQAIRRLHDGAIGSIVAGQVVRLSDAARHWRPETIARKPEWSEMEHHIRRWFFWTWTSGDFIVEMHVHNLDIMNWILAAHPVSCLGMGGRQARVEMEFGNVYDHFSVEYLYPNDVRVEYLGAQIDRFTYRLDHRVQGTKGSAYLDFGNAWIKGKKSWKYKGTHADPAVLEFTDMIDSIRKGKAINEGRQVAEATLTAVMGRMSAYTGREIKWDWVLNASQLDLSPRPTPEGLQLHKEIAVPGQTPLI